MIATAFYAAGAYVQGPQSLDPHQSILPLGQLTGRWFEAVTKRRWIDSLTGEVLHDYDPESDPSRVVGDFAIAYSASAVEQLTGEQFMLSLHLLAVLLIGYGGGQYAARKTVCRPSSCD